jgi:RNA polymerase sigma-70 factor (ECF subfamily)
MSILSSEAATVESTVRSAATGDEAAFARLVATHHAAMSRVAFVILGEVEATHDAVQSAWAIAWRDIGSLRDPARVHAWLVAVAANEARQAVRRRRRDRVVDISEALAHADDQGDPIDSLDVVDLERALRGLKAEDRSLLAMRFVAGLDSAEIAQQIGLTASGVRSRLAKVLERLRVHLAVPPEIDQ